MNLMAKKTPPVSPSDSKKSAVFWSFVEIAWELGYLISLPLLLFIFTGRLLDKKLGTAPWLLIAGIIISILISAVLVYFKVIKFAARIVSEDQKSPIKSDQDRPNK